MSKQPKGVDPMTRTLLIAAGAVLLASTSIASAQVRHHSPGYRADARAHTTERRVNRYQRGPITAPRTFYRDDPPGSEIEDRGLRNEHGEH
jgi:hypothetical protein